MISLQEYQDRLQDVRLLVTDVDGVLTPGTILYGDGGLECKHFHVRDGVAMYLASQIGLRTAVITGRTSEAVARRFNELPVDAIRQGCLDKIKACAEIEAEFDLKPQQVAFLGDDLIDLPLIERVGLGITVADGHSRLRECVDWVTRAEGGRAALREVVDDAITARDLWDQVLEDYRSRLNSAPEDV